MSTLLQQKRISTPPLRRSSGKVSGGEEANPEPVAGTGKPKRSFVRRWIAAGMILGTALLTVGFVANAIEVNGLLASITSLDAEHDAVRRENERLRAELLRLMSVEQVTARATELGMIQPEAPPIALPLSGGESESKGERKQAE